MSYTRRYRETITVSGSQTESVSYPASQNGGTTSVTVYYTEEVPVDVNIHVDTVPFDNSVNHVTGKIDLLTGAVVATEVAEIESKAVNAKKVGDSIISGFFSYIRSEISQQVAELSQNIDAHLMHLRELSQSCIAKKKQMEGDYLRITGRYVKIFDDLNNEVKNRIYELDKSAFVFKEETDNQKIRTFDNTLVNVVTIFGLESSSLQSKIGVSIAKKRALNTLNKSKSFLWNQNKLNATIQNCMLNENKACSVFTPVCFVETNNINNQIDKKVYSSQYLSALNDKSLSKRLVEEFSSDNIKWENLPMDNQKNISLFFNEELNSRSSANDKHSVRVREMIQKLAAFDSIGSLTY
jgi:hypothetical protein